MSELYIDNGIDPDKGSSKGSGSEKRGKLDGRIQALQEKLRRLEQRQAVKHLKKQPTFAQMMKTRRMLIGAVEVFEQDKDNVPLEVLSLSKRLIYAINAAEENLEANGVESQEAPEA
jgi:hypothetical protein